MLNDILQFIRKRCIKQASSVFILIDVIFSCKSQQVKARCRCDAAAGFNTLQENTFQGQQTHAVCPCT